MPTAKRTSRIVLAGVIAIATLLALGVFAWKRYQEAQRVAERRDAWRAYERCLLRTELAPDETMDERFGALHARDYHWPDRCGGDWQTLVDILGRTKGVNAQRLRNQLLTQRNGTPADPDATWETAASLGFESDLPPFAEAPALLPRDALPPFGWGDAFAIAETSDRLAFVQEGERRRTLCRAEGVVIRCWQIPSSITARPGTASGHWPPLLSEDGVWLMTSWNHARHPYDSSTATFAHSTADELVVVDTGYLVRIRNDGAERRDTPVSAYLAYPYLSEDGVLTDLRSPPEDLQTDPTLRRWRACGDLPQAVGFVDDRIVASFPSGTGRGEAPRPARSDLESVACTEGAIVVTRVTQIEDDGERNSARLDPTVLTLAQVRCSPARCETSTSRVEVPESASVGGDVPIAMATTSDETILAFQGWRRELRIRRAPFEDLARAPDRVVTNPGWRNDDELSVMNPQLAVRAAGTYLLFQNFWRTETRGVLLRENGAIEPLVTPAYRDRD